MPYPEQEDFKYRDDFERDFVKAMKWSPFVANQDVTFKFWDGVYASPTVQLAFEWYIVGRKSGE